jgi:putative transposase
MALSPQSIRTFFVTSNTLGRRTILRSEKMAGLLVQTLQTNRRSGRFQLHELVIMPDHFHLLLTPASNVPLEKALQYIKGGFSYHVKTELNRNFPIWQASFTNHRIRDAEDYEHHRVYIWQNPVKAGLVERPELFPYSSAFPGTEVDEAPPGLKPRSMKASLSRP